jgi:hypothetical protein
MDIGFDPISLENIKVDKWLKEDKDNIVFFLDESIKNSKKIILLNKSYFLNPNINDIYKKCIIENNALMVNETYEDLIHWKNIGFYLDNYTMINSNNLIKTLKSNKRVFKLIKLKIIEQFISKELLELSQVKLSRDIWDKTKKHKKQNGSKTWIADLQSSDFKELDDILKNLPYNEEVYFDEILSNALICYSGNSYKCINGYLRFGPDFFDSGTFKQNCINNEYLNENMKLHPDYNNIKSGLKLKKDLLDYLTKYLKWDKKKQEEKKKLKKIDLIKELDELIKLWKMAINNFNNRISKENIIDKINKLDKCFLELAPRISDNTKYYYRGMTQLYDGLNNINDSISINSYLSLSTNPNIPYNSYFWKSSIQCCYYRFKIDKGVPYINMINNTINKNEDEILLPYNLKLTLTNISDKTRLNGITHKLFDIYVEMIHSEQFKIDTGCNKYDIVDILSMPNNKFNKIKTVKSKSENVVDNLDILPVTDIMDKDYVKRIVKEAFKLNKTIKFVQINPKKISTKSYERYERYKSAKNILDILKLGGSKGDIENDFKKGYLNILESKTNKSISKPVLTDDKKLIITPNNKPNPQRLNDALENLITINGHGGFNPEKIVVPEWCQIMIPHVNGLETDYTTPDASKDKLYEEDLYKNKYFNYKEGWRLYLPGDMINNLAVSIFHDASSCNTINEYHTLQKPLSNKCKSGTNFSKFCPLYCTQQKTVGEPGFDYIHYKGKRKLKIKACSGYYLKELFDNLKVSLSKITDDDKKEISPNFNDPILLIPFTCNAKAGSKLNRFNNDINKEHLTNIYHKLYDERFPQSKKVKVKVNKTLKNCKKYKMRKDPKCNDQEGCEWVVNKGCSNK